MNKVIINGIEQELRTSNTKIGNLDTLLHAMKSAQYCSKSRSFIIQGTDSDSIEHLETFLEGVNGWATSTIGAVGLLIAHADMQQLPAYEISNIGFLLNGLAELSDLLQEVSEVLHNTRINLLKIEKPA